MIVATNQLVKPDLVARRVRAILEREGLTHREAARQCGTSTWAIQGLAAGNLPRISEDLLSKVAAGLGTTVSALLRGARVAGGRG